MITHAEYIAMQARCWRTSLAGLEEATVGAAAREIGKGGLQAEISEWCDAQWPRWVYDFPRTDLRSTLPLGRHDSTIWGPGKKCFCIETKARGKKRTRDQLIWAARLRPVGWDVHVIYSLAEFLALVEREAAGTPAPAALSR